MRHSALAAAALLCLGPAAALADTPGLDPALQRLLAAAADSKAANDFADAVRLLALTADAQAILAAADELGRKGEAREALGLDPAPASPRDAAAAAARGETATPARPDDARGWTAAPAALASAVYGAQSDLWDGRVKFGMRFDAGNSNREDFAGAIELERALMGWGFEGGVEYAYSRVDGQVGRDELIAQARGERELGERFTAYASGEYEQDALNAYSWTGFLGGGLGYRVVDRDEASFVLRAGPGARLLDDIEGPLLVRGALDLGADLAVPVTESVSFGAETTLLLATKSRADQRFTLSSALGELWAIELKFRYRHEFEPEPGFEKTDTRTDLSIVREF
ncbi:DUF481 domain-containing protein [Marinicauda algicola]|nr:DUF481 domain-containing protein [Marinicauda algicola]